MSEATKTAITAVTLILGIITMVIGIFATTAFVIVLCTAINGWIFMKLWLWFAVPIFHLPVLTLIPAMGVALLVRFLTVNDDVSSTVKNLYAGAEKKKKNDDEEAAAARDAAKSAVQGMAITAFISPFLILLFGYILHFLMLRP